MTLEQFKEYLFQTPFGITACESVSLRSCSYVCRFGFKRLSASLHVKERPHSALEILALPRPVFKHPPKKISKIDPNAIFDPLRSP